MATKPRLRDTSNRNFTKHATAYITNVLKEQAEAFDIGIKSMVRDKLQKTYVDNVRASYAPRTTRGQSITTYNKEKYREHKKKLTYRHTGTFANSIYTKIDGKNIKVMIRDDVYSDGTSTTQVYEWLTKGTMGGEKTYPYIKRTGNDNSNPDNYSTGWSRNFPTPAHLFEEHTKLQMIGYLESFISDLQNNEAEAIQNKYRTYIRKRK